MNRIADLSTTLFDLRGRIIGKRSNVEGGNGLRANGIYIMRVGDHTSGTESFTERLMTAQKNKK